VGEKRHIDPEDVYVKQEKIGISRFGVAYFPGQGSFGSVYKG
jgi:serine/threonine-protein kinase 24/25/MST4